jgi:hypothetical protein
VITVSGLRTANLFYQTTPYHIVATDFLTAYVNLPAWQGWLLWRGYVYCRTRHEPSPLLRALRSPVSPLLIASLL